LYVANLCAEFGYCRALEEWEYGNFRYAELKENYHETDMLAVLKENSSVSRFQEKEKRGEMITINDNIK
jgi:hypothetical protein